MLNRSLGNEIILRLDFVGLLVYKENLLTLLGLYSLLLA